MNRNKEDKHLERKSKKQRHVFYIIRRYVKYKTNS